MLEEAKFAHASITLAALALVLLCDIRLVLRYFKPLSDEVYWQLQLTAKVMPWLVLGLWVSGGLLISAHLENDPMYYLNNSKLQAKLILAMLLTLNGMLLSRTTLTYVQPDSVLAQSSHRLWMAVQAVTSGSLWMVCSFLGLIPNTHLETFSILGSYFLYWVVACLSVAAISYYIPFFTILMAALRGNPRPE